MKYTLFLSGLEPIPCEKEIYARACFEDAKRGMIRGNVLCKEVVLKEGDKTLDRFFLSEAEIKQREKFIGKKYT